MRNPDAFLRTLLASASRLALLVAVTTLPLTPAFGVDGGGEGGVHTR